MFTNFIECVSVVYHIISITATPLLCPLIFGYILLYGEITRYLAFACLVDLYYDIKYNEGVFSPKAWYRESFLYKSTIRYFPIKIAATADIPQNCNYIIGIHPHGVMPYSGMMYACRDNEFKKIFGQNNVAMCTAPFNMRLPLQRFLWKGIGAITATESAIIRRLTAAPAGSHVAIPMGGAEEALIATGHRIILKKRKGFCRLALITGTHLLPTYAYGQNKIFDVIVPPEGSFLRKVQMFILKNLSVSVPIFKGPGKWQYFLTIPKREPITTVYGKPIPVEKVENPTREQINELHAKYVSGMIELFESTKETYLGDKSAQLVIE